MYVYRTPQFNDKAERYGILARIDDWCTELETQRIDEVQARFERVYPYLKRRILNQRIVARILRVDEEQLLCLIDIFKRGDNEYEQFLESPIEYGRSHLEPQLDRQHLRGWVQEQKIQQRSTQQLPELPAELHPWLELPAWEMESPTEDWIIYESEEWVTQFRKPEIQSDWETYYQIISEIREGTNQAEESPDLSNVKLCGLNNHYVLYSQPITTDTGIVGVLFLLAPFDHKPTRKEIIEVGKRTALFDVPVEDGEDDTETREHGEAKTFFTEFRLINTVSSQSQSNTTHNILARQLNLCDLTPFARRSYPAYLLADEESWLAIERGKEANLALSAEEEQILKSVSTSAPGKGSLPLFINGRAGSGKSTMLLYLFADYCYRKYYKQGHRRTEALPGEPLFLTYNERLLEVAREGVKTLLSSHHRFVAERSQGDERDKIDHFFQPFQSFLFSLLPPEEGKYFDFEKYISFHRFKQLYQGKSPSESLAKVVLHLPEARQYSPEICWHVIRSFIKGYHLEDCITPEDYQKDVPRKERTISIEKFQGIYYTIWERWYKRITQEQGYWDDQDLIARVLKLKCYRPEYTAIFCDEAQDFTRLELQLIMRLSIFSQYHLGYQPIHCLPFAFAGDPFQTLNPTGFHWSSVQAVFDAEVITALDPAEQLKLVINFQELSFNYRSSPPIVQVTNLIQLWRHVLFDIHELQPQTAWQQGNFLIPQKFILNANINTIQLADYIKDTIIIVPCEEGEEAAYAQADEILSELFPQSSSEPLKNVLSAISAKGLEFKKVILYKFGEDCNRGVWTSSQRTDQQVQIEYFFNKLYVAASRATERLFVVDSEKGDRQLWQQASHEALLQAILKRTRNKVRWEATVQTISLGTPNTAQDLREDDPLSIAQEFEIKGLNSQNSGFLRRARQFYKDFGNTVKANFCEAWALKFEEQFQAAGNLFLQLGEAGEAWDCFWKGLCWLELVNGCNQYPEHPVESAIANFMIALPQDVQAITDFTSLISRQLLGASNHPVEGTGNNKRVAPDKQWKKAVEEYTKRIGLLLNNADTFNNWQQIGEVLEVLNAAGYPGRSLLAGECFYRAKNYEQAVYNWEAGGATQTPEYNRAKVLLLGYPNGLEYLEKAGEADRIITEWERAEKPRDRRWLKYVAPALEAKRQYEQAFVVYVWLDELVKVITCFEAASQGSPKFKLFTVLLQYFYRKKHFTEAIEAIEKYLPIVISSEYQKASLKFEIVYEIACSELTPDNLTKDYRKRYQKFIKDQILSSSEWQQYLLMPQLGIALEKIGSIVETLEFYEQFITHSEEHLRQFARERWIATKKQQEDYARKQKQFDKASKTHSEILKKARNWSIQQQSVLIEPPLPPKERPTPPIPESTAIQSPSKLSITQLVIKGLPASTKIEQLKTGVVRFSLRHLVIKVMRQSQQVLITDALNSREVRVDGVQCKVSIGDAIVEAVGSKQLSFALSPSGYSGNLICDAEKPRLELNIQGYLHKISIELS